MSNDRLIRSETTTRTGANEARLMCFDHLREGDMYDEILLLPRQGDESWEDDHAALEAAWRAIGVCPVPVARFSTGADFAGHFYFMAVAASAAGGFILPRRAFDALNIWLKGRADRRVHLKLADGTELSAATTVEIERLAETVERLRRGGHVEPSDVQGAEPSTTGNGS